MCFIFFNFQHRFSLKKYFSTNKHFIFVTEVEYNTVCHSTLCRLSLWQWQSKGLTSLWAGIVYLYPIHYQKLYCLVCFQNTGRDILKAYLIAYCKVFSINKWKSFKICLFCCYSYREQPGSCTHIPVPLTHEAAIFSNFLFISLPLIPALCQ